MKNITLIFIITCSIFQQLHAQYFYKEGYIQITNTGDAIKSLSFKNLEIYPLIAGQQFVDANRDVGKYTTLKESLAQQKIRITETEAAPSQDNSRNSQAQLVRGSSNSATVNTLYIQNISKDTIFVMAGEVVKGGKQDRVIAQDMILPPHSEKIDLAVFCVEKGRWTYKEHSQFDGYFSVVSNSVRKTVIKEKNQTAVWDKVDITVSRNKAESSTGAYTNLGNAEDYQKELKEYLSYFGSKFKDTNNCIGFVGVSGDRIIGCDIFATAELFEKQKEGILKGYITEAIVSDTKPDLEFNEVEKYLNYILTSKPEEQDSHIEEKGSQFKHNNKKLHISTFE